MKMLKDKMKHAAEAMTKKAKTTALVVLPVAGGVLLPVVSHAAEVTPLADNAVTDVFDAVSQSMLTSFQSMATAMGSLIGSIVPYALPIVGVVMLVGIGVKMFRRVLGNA